MLWINCFSFSRVCNHPASFAGSTHLLYVFPSSFPLPLPSISLQISVASPLQPDVDVPMRSLSIRWPSSELLCHCCCSHVCVDIAPSSLCLEWAQKTEPGTFFFSPPPMARWPLAVPFQCSLSDSGGVLVIVRAYVLVSWSLHYPGLPPFQIQLAFLIHKGLAYYWQQRKKKNWVINLLPPPVVIRPLVLYNELLFAGVYKRHSKPPALGLFHLLCIHRLFCFGLLCLWEMSAAASLERMHLMMLLIHTHKDIERSTH